LQVITGDKSKTRGIKMKRLFPICVTMTVVMMVFAFKLQSQVVEPLKFVQSIPLPGLKDGDFEHFALDSAGQRLFLGAEDNLAIAVIDLHTNKLIHTITGLKTPPHSLAYRADLKKLYVVIGDDEAGGVKVFDTDSYKPAGDIELNKGADSSIYDPSAKYMYVVNGGSDAHMAYSFISVIDTTNAKNLADIKIESNSVEAMALEKSGPRMFVNVRGNAAVAVIDREKRTISDTWSIAQEGKGNTAMAYDEANHRLFVVARDPGKFIVLNSDSGKIVATLPCAGQTDDAFYDPSSKRIYVSGVPFLYVFEQRGANNYRLVGQLPSSFHAVTSLLVPELHQYFLAVPHHGDTEAEVQIYKPVL
jgi:DNA-binding beta-propeller fold protein YncE